MAQHCFVARACRSCRKVCKKRPAIYIEGRIKTRSYDDKDGNKKYITEIYADVMQMLGSKSDNQQTRIRFAVQITTSRNPNQFTVCK